MRSLLIAAASFSIVGCTTETDSTTQSQSNTPGTATTAAEPIGEPLPPAKSPEELVANYKTAFESGNQAAIEAMVHWECAEEHRESMLALLLLVRMAGKAKITNTIITDPHASDISRAEGCKLKPHKTLEFDTEDNDGLSSSNQTVTIVKVNDTFLFHICVPPQG